MASEKEIVVTLKADNSVSNVDNSAEIEKVKKPAETETGNAGLALAKAYALKMGEQALNEAITWGEYYWNKELVLADDYIGQRNKNIAIQLINKGVSTAGGLISGGLTGAAIGGPVGAVVGVAFAAVTSIVSTVSDIFRKQDEQNIKLRQMDAQLSYTRQRAGWSLEAASIGEDL